MWRLRKRHRLQAARADPDPQSPASQRRRATIAERWQKDGIWNSILVYFGCSYQLGYSGYLDCQVAYHSMIYFLKKMNNLGYTVIILNLCDDCPKLAFISSTFWDLWSLEMEIGSRSMPRNWIWCSWKWPKTSKHVPFETFRHSKYPHDITTFECLPCVCHLLRDSVAAIADSYLLAPHEGPGSPHSSRDLCLRSADDESSMKVHNVGIATS